MNELEIQMLGLSRSGNHAIADWIWLQARGPRLLLNCCEGKTNPYLSCRPMGPKSGGWRESEPGLFATGRDGRHVPKALLLHSYEDSWLRHAFSPALETHHNDWLGPSRRRVSLIVVRDPFNLFASRRRAGCAMPPHIERKMWKQHAKAALGLVQNIPGEICIIRYNDWASDAGYRADLAHHLGLRFTDAGAERVPPTCGGSSFDGTAFEGRASAMATDERWQHFACDPAYRGLFDRELVMMSTQLFGPPPHGLGWDEMSDLQAVQSSASI